jgi:hypothetical protein
MKSTWPPPQVIFVGLELNQHGQAASQEHASSSWPVIFHGVLSFGSFAPRRGDPRKMRLVTSAQGKRDVVFIGLSVWPPAFQDKPILTLACQSYLRAARPSPPSRRANARRSSLCLPLRSKRRLERVTRLELATSSLARRCSTTELHPQFQGKQ